jgi:hypothetical protein
MISDLPEEIPVGWSLREWDLRWMPRNTALRVLRHQTMLVYLLLILVEGLYLIVRWARGAKGDIAGRLLTWPHWLYFFFRVGWITLFAGLNLGLVQRSVGGGSLLPHLLPGLTALAGFGILLALMTRRSGPAEAGP